MAVARKLYLEILIFEKGELVDTTAHPAIHDIATPH
jgi:hypothetical protein